MSVHSFLLVFGLACTGGDWSYYPLPKGYTGSQGDFGGDKARDFIDRGFVFGIYPRTDHRSQDLDGSLWQLAAELVTYAKAAEGLE